MPGAGESAGEYGFPGPPIETCGIAPRGGAEVYLATRRRYPKDTVVFFENEAGDFFFTIVQGRIKVTILGDDGREIILSILGPGQLPRATSLADLIANGARPGNSPV